MEDKEKNAQLRELLGGYKLFSVSSLLTKQVGLEMNSTLTNGFRSAESEDAALGAYTRCLQEEFPGFSIKSVLIIEIVFELN